MKNVFYEGKGCRFMSWEQNPNKRNVNNRVSFLVNEAQEVNTGDILVGDALNGAVRSTYTIVEITSRRESKQNGHHYIEVLTDRSASEINYDEFITVSNIPKLI